jgi:hypothetical protein
VVSRAASSPASGGFSPSRDSWLMGVSYPG